MPPLMPKRNDYQQIRANVPKEIYTLLKRLSGVKGITLSDVIMQAIDVYLETEQVQEEIKFYRLDREINDSNGEISS